MGDFLFLFLVYLNYMSKIFFLIAGLLILAFIGYKFFHLDSNTDVQDSIKSQDFKVTEKAVENAIAEQLTLKAKQYLHDHNNYFVSASNNLCTSAQSIFTGIEKFTSNPVECVAQAHSFTARIKKIGSDSYLCADASGFYTAAVTEEGYRPGVQCK
jgi:hypothetical protein